MNNLDKLWAYIKEKAPPGGIPDDDDRQYRDLKQYYEKKVSRWSGTDAEKRQALDLVNDPLDVCGLTPEGRELCQPNTSKELAVVANLLAMSIVQNIDRETLRNEMVILARRSIRNLSNVEASLKIILTKGDLVESQRIPGLELKNFGSLDQRTTRSWKARNFIEAAENAYQGARTLLWKINEKLKMWRSVRGKPGIPQGGAFEQTFKAYFGDPDAKVDMGTLGFQGGAPPTLTGGPTRGAVVHAVLDRVWQGLRTRPVRLYFGGGTICSNVKAYTNQKVRNDGRINVHLAYGFFTDHGEQAIKGVASSRAGVLIHEFTHALAGTVDVHRDFSHTKCRELAKWDTPVLPGQMWGVKALTNAQNYACFVEDALG